jgi:hypothetical protein
MLKSELELALSTHLDQHADTLKSDPTFAAYYDTLAPTRSPVKRTVKTQDRDLDVSFPDGTTRSRRRTSRYVPGMTGSAESTYVPLPAIVLLLPLPARIQLGGEAMTSYPPLFA